MKFAAREGRYLRVFVERSGREIDDAIHEYYRELRSDGMPFAATMSTYQPLSHTEFARALRSFATKTKQSRLMQLADLCLYPVCRAGYDTSGQAYGSLVSNRKLLDDHLPKCDLPREGIKYSCFEHVRRQQA